VGRHRPLGASHLHWLQATKARNLCIMAKQADPRDREAICRRLIETLSAFGRDDPEAKIRARACGCPVR
jgi:hypothetical protein